MSDAPPPGRAEPAPDRPPAPLTPARVDTVLADFRGWLQEVAGAGREAAASESPPKPVDLHTLVAQFTALRHEMNLQTRATRAAVEQNAEALKLLSQPPDAPADPDEAVRPLVKALVDIADSLAIGLRQTEKARRGADELLRCGTEDEPSAPPPAAGWWGRLLGRGVADDGTRPAAAPDLADRLTPLLAGVADGYTLSLRRVERALPAFGLEPVEVVGRPFDPESMEVVEVVEAAGRPAGIVVEEVRRGYRWNGTLFRFAQVKVAR